MENPKSEFIRVITLKRKERQGMTLETLDGELLLEKMEKDIAVEYTISGVNVAVLDKETIIVFVTLKMWDTNRKSILHMTLSEARGRLGELGNKTGVTNLITDPSWKDVLVQDFLNTPTSRIGKKIRMVGPDTVNSLKRIFKTLNEKES